jgi:hypothetical protein
MQSAPQTFNWTCYSRDPASQFELMKNQPARLRLLFVLCGGVCAVLLAWMFLGPNKNSRLLPDGSSLRLEIVGYGQNSFPIYYGSRLERLFCQAVTKVCGSKVGIVPGYTNMNQRVKLNSAVVSLQNASLGVWIANTKVKQPGTLRHCVVLDDQQQEIGTGARHLGTTRDSKGSLFTAWEFNCFPRRSKKITLRVMERGQNALWQILADFTIANPGFRSYPELLPTENPIIERAGENEFELTSVTTGIHEQGESAPWGRLWTRISTMTRVNGVETDFWIPTLLSVSDGTPNKYANLAHRASEKGNQVEFAGILDPREAVKLRLSFAKYKGFASNELWVLRDIPVPGSGKSTNLNRVHSFGDCTVTLSEFSTGLASHSEQENSRWSRIRADASPPRKKTDHLLISLVAVLDSKGINHKESGVNMDLTDWVYVGMFTPTNLLRADLIFAVHKSEEIEFTAKPKLAK